MQHVGLTFNHHIGPSCMFLSHLLWITHLLAFRYIRFGTFNFCLFILQLWAHFSEPRWRPNWYKIQEGGLQGVHEWQLYTAQSADRGGGTPGNPGQVVLMAHRLSVINERIDFQNKDFTVLLIKKRGNTDNYSRRSVILQPVRITAACKDGFQMR